MMTLQKNYFILLLFSCILGYNLVVLYTIHATTSITLNNFVNDYEIDGFVSTWYYNMTDQQDISVRFDSTTLRLVTGVRLTYRTQNLLNPMADCNVSYKFESSEYVYYNDILPNTTGDNWTHAFYAQGDTFLMTNSSFYIDLGVASDDPYIQVGFDKDHSGYSMYSLNGGPWTPDTVEYLMEAIVENVTTLGEKENVSGIITPDTDFVDAYRLTLTTGDVSHFYVKSATPGKYFNMRLFPVSTKLTSDSNAIWLEEGPTSEKSKQYSSVTGEYVLLVEPNTDGVDNGTYYLSWTYDPEPPTVNMLPPYDNGTVELSWSSSPDADVAYYNLYRGTTVDVPMDSAHLISELGTITGNSFNDTTWLLEGQYFYTVAAVDNTGHESTKSNVVNTTVFDTSDPNPPMNLTYQRQDHLLLLNWSAPTDPDLEFYYIFRSMTPIQNISTMNPIANTTLTSWVAAAPPPGTYYYAVIAVDLNGRRSSMSNTVSVMILNPPSYTLPIILIVLFSFLVGMLGYGVYDSHRNPNSIFQRLFRRYFRGLLNLPKRAWTKWKKQTNPLENYLNLGLRRSLGRMKLKILILVRTILK